MAFTIHTGQGILYDVPTAINNTFPPKGRAMLLNVDNESKLVTHLQGFLEVVFVVSNRTSFSAQKFSATLTVDAIILPVPLGTKLFNLMSTLHPAFNKTFTGDNSQMLADIHGKIQEADPLGLLIPHIALSIRELPDTGDSDLVSTMSIGTIVGIMLTALASLAETKPVGSVQCIMLPTVVSAVGLWVYRTHRFAQARKRLQRRRLERQRQAQLLLEGGVPLAPEIHAMRRDRAVLTFFTAMTRPEAPPIQRCQLNAIKSFLITKKRMAAIQARWRENQCDQTCALHVQAGGLSTILTNTGTVALEGAPLPRAPTKPGPAPHKELVLTSSPQPDTLHEDISGR
ncbi:hypothetical protein H4R34_001227, partial [Dimargaris verticillata]